MVHIICSQRPMCVGNQQALGCCQAHRHLASAGFSASSVEKYHCPVYESSPYQWQTGICSWSSRLAAFTASWRTLCMARRTGMYLLVWIFSFQGSVSKLRLSRGPFTDSETNQREINGQNKNIFEKRQKNKPASLWRPAYAVRITYSTPEEFA